MNAGRSMSRGSVNIGVIGCGVIGKRHLASASTYERIRIAAVADLDEALAREQAAEFGAAAAYGSAEALIADANVEAVVLAMPTGVRTPLAIKALEAGRHVLLEKPAAMNVGEVDRMIEAKGGRVAACASSRFRFSPYAEPVRKAIASGRLGAIREVRIVHHRPCGKPNPNPVAWRLRKAANGGGYLVNWGVYDLDYLLGVTDWALEPETVLAQTWPIAGHLQHHVAEGSDAETHVSALIRCRSGATISMTRAEYAATSQEDGWQIIGERGAIRQPVGSGESYAVFLDTAEASSGTRTETLWEGEATWEPAHAGPVRDLADAVLDGREPATPLEKARVIQSICDAVYASAESGRCAPLP